MSPRIWCAFLLALVAPALSGCLATAPPADPGAITAAGALATPKLLVGEETRVYAVVRIGTRSRAEHAAGPVNVALCIDTSGSMEGEPIEAARKAALAMVASMKDGDRLAIVVFHTKTEVVLPSTELDDEVRAEVAGLIGGLEAVGTTDLAGGLQAALSEVEQSYQEDAVNRVVLLGDGVPNHPISVEGIAGRAAGRGISITALGLGLDYDEVLMGKLAEKSGGRYRYVASADKLGGFFAEELARLHSVHARNVAVTLTPGPGVVIESVAGASSPPSGGAIVVPLGDLARGETRDVVVRMKVTARKAKAPVELLDAAITFEDALVEAGQLDRRVYFGAYGSDDAEEVAAARRPDVELEAALAEAGATTVAALELAKQQRYVEAREILTKGAEAAKEQAARTPSEELAKQASDMLAVAGDMPAENPAPPMSFEDEALESGSEVYPSQAAPAPAEALEPEAAKRRKEVHDQSYQMSH